MPVPVIAVLHGMCFGAGLQIALGADMRYATADCKLSIMEGKWGLIPDMGASITLRELTRIDIAKVILVRFSFCREEYALLWWHRLNLTLVVAAGAVAVAVAAFFVTQSKELTMTGRIISGEEAAALGLVTSTCDDPWEHAENLAGELLQRSPDALASAKDLYQRTWSGDPSSEEECLKVETELQEKLLASFNQMAASGRAFGWNIPYAKRKE